MPDITMCPGHAGVINCPQKDNCYRYTANPSDYQWYFQDLPMQKDETCEHFWDNSGYKKRDDHHNKKS